MAEKNSKAKFQAPGAPVTPYPMGPAAEWVPMVDPTIASREVLRSLPAPQRDPIQALPATPFIEEQGMAADANRLMKAGSDMKKMMPQESVSNMTNKRLREIDRLRNQ